MCLFGSFHGTQTVLMVRGWWRTSAVACATSLGSSRVHQPCYIIHGRQSSGDCSGGYGIDQNNGADGLVAVSNSQSSR
jgi:hypothetical protein